MGENPSGEIKVWNFAIPIIFCYNCNQTILFLGQILIFIKKKQQGILPQSEKGEKTHGGNQSVELNYTNHFLQ